MKFMLTKLRFLNFQNQMDGNLQLFGALLHYNNLKTDKLRLNYYRKASLHVWPEHRYRETL